MRLPNLELLQYKAEIVLSKNDKARERIVKKKNKRITLDFKAYVFPQVWSSTATAFDVDAFGNAVMSGQAFTEVYTTIFYEKLSDMYLVFVDNEFAYLVYDASDKFLEDFKNQKIGTISYANKHY